MTPKEFIRKCEWEGGALYEGFQYGLRLRDLDDSDPKFNKLVEEFEKHWIRTEKANEEMLSYCQEHEIGEEFDDGKDYENGEE